MTPISALFIASSLLLTGCANGTSAPTRMIKQVTDGVEADIGSLKIRNLTIVTQADGSGVLVGTFINYSKATDAITSIVVNDIPAVISPAQPVLATDAPVTFEGAIANASARIPGLNVEAGKRAKVVITFASEASTTLDSLVVAKDGDFANVGN